MPVPFSCRQHEAKIRFKVASQVLPPASSVNECRSCCVSFYSYLPTFSDKDKFPFNPWSVSRNGQSGGNAVECRRAGSDRISTETPVIRFEVFMKFRDNMSIRSLLLPSKFCPLHPSLHYSTLYTYIYYSYWHRRRRTDKISYCYSIWTLYLYVIHVQLTNDQHILPESRNPFLLLLKPSWFAFSS